MASVRVPASQNSSCSSPERKVTLVSVDSASRVSEIAGQEWLALGYGSGDAAEALPMRVGAGWRDAAARINFAEALGTPTDLSEAEYLALHEGRTLQVQAAPVHDEFVVDHVGTLDGPDFHDLGIEYYRFVGPAARG